MLQRIVRNFTAAVRNDTMEGRDYLVVPMIMIVEGVLNGSSGPLYYPKDELAKTPGVWNHKPVVVNHPDGTACSPEEITNRKIGVIMNTTYDDGKLKAEAWLEEERMETVNNRVLEAVLNGEMLELSTGLQTENEIVNGDFNGTEYIAIARNYKPDHLAVLPYDRGACSIDDGAGFLRLNKEDNSFTVSLTALANEEKKKQGIFNHYKDTYLVQHLSYVLKNELSFDDKRQMLYSITRDRLDKDVDFWIEDIFDEYYVYEVSGVFHKQLYTEVKGQLELTGLPVVVTKKIDYVVTNKKEIERTIQMDKKELVASLIANAQTTWSDEDKETLMAMDEDVLTKMVPVENKAVEPEAKADDKVEDKKVDNAQPVENQEAKPVTLADYIAKAPVEMRGVLQNGLDSFNAEKKRLVNTIMAFPKNAYTEIALNEKGLDELKCLTSMIAPQVANVNMNLVPVYDGQGDGVTANAIADDVFLPKPIMNFGEKGNAEAK